MNTTRVIYMFTTWMGLWSNINCATFCTVLIDTARRAVPRTVYHSFITVPLSPLSVDGRCNNLPHNKRLSTLNSLDFTFFFLSLLDIFCF